MKKVTIKVKVTEEKKDKLTCTAKEIAIDRSQLISNLIDDYIEGKKDYNYSIDKERKLVKTFVELNTVCSGIENKEERDRILFLLGELQCLC